LLPLGVLPRPRLGHRSDRAEPSSASRCSHPNELPEALREFGLRVRAIMRPLDAKASRVRAEERRDRSGAEALPTLARSTCCAPRVHTDEAVGALGNRP